MFSVRLLGAALAVVAIAGCSPPVASPPATPGGPSAPAPTAPGATPVHTTASATDSTQGWITTSSPEGHLTVKHPPGWHEQLCPAPGDSALAGVVLSATVALDAAACGELGPGFVTVRSASGDHRADFSGGGSRCGRTNQASVTVSGVTGSRIRVAYDRGSIASCDPPPTVGSSAITYVFFDGARSWLASYTFDPARGLPDDSATFDTMVSRTLTLIR